MFLNVLSLTNFVNRFSDIFVPYIHDTSTLLRLALPANGDLDRDGLPLISHLTVLSAIHCSTGLTLDTSEVYISDMNQCLRNARHVPPSEAVVGVLVGVEEKGVQCGTLLSGGADGVVGG